MFPSFSLRAAWKFLRVYVTAWIRAAASGSLGGALEGAVTHWDGQLPLVPGMGWPLVKDNRHFPLLTPWKASYHRVLPSRMWGTIWSYRFICFLLYHGRVFFMVCYGNQMRNMLDCHSKTSQTEWLKLQKFIFLQFWGLEFWDQGVGRVGLSWGLFPQDKHTASFLLPL